MDTVYTDTFKARKLPYDHSSELFTFNILLMQFIILTSNLTTLYTLYFMLCKNKKYKSFSNIILVEFTFSSCTLIKSYNIKIQFLNYVFQYSLCNIKHESIIIICTSSKPMNISRVYNGNIALLKYYH